MSRQRRLRSARHSAALAAGLLAAMAAGCDLEPAYDPPKLVLPASYQGSAPWQVARPSDHVAAGPWWESYGNPTLDRLEAKIPDNPDLQAERESFEQARELAAEAQAGLFPQIGANYQMSQNRSSQHRLFHRPGSPAPLEEPSVQLDLAASWELDLWDRIGNQAKARERLAQAEAANLAGVELSLQAELANAYITLRGLDLTAKLYEQTIGSYRRALDITQMRLGDKIGSQLDVARAQAQLSSAEAQLHEIQSQRALAQHAIADLIGVPASGWSLGPQDGTPLVLPRIPTGLPADLLERRPDIAAAERSMAAANAEIGVARAAFYPDISLSGTAGAEDAGFNLASLPNRLWSIGSSIAQPIFEGGLLEAQLRYAKSSYAQTRDGYRATVLAAFQQVEDQLSLNDLLAQEATADHAAFGATAQAQSLAMQLYTSGASTYIEVVVAQIAALQASGAEIGVDVRLQQASINLVRALGGGWATTKMPGENAVLPADAP